MNKLYKNTYYYYIKLESRFSQKMTLNKIKIIGHKGNCNTSPKQIIKYKHDKCEKEQTTILLFSGKILKQQNNKIFKISDRIALCLTINDCKHFVRQYYKTDNFGWWIPKGNGIVTRTYYKSIMKQLQYYVHNNQ